MSKKSKQFRKIMVADHSRPIRQHSIEDIDELTEMFKFGLKAGRKIPISASAASLMQSVLTEARTNKSMEEFLKVLPQQVEVSQDFNQSEEEKSGETGSSEEQTSEVSISDRIQCIKFTSVENFAKLFVDEIIDISVDVCDKLFQAAIGGEDTFSEVSCICDSEVPNTLEIERNQLPCVEKKEFSGWPTIKHFTVEGAKKKIKEFMDQWYFVEKWKYTVHYIASYSDSVSDYHLFQGMWSIPTKEYPVAQATATIFFTIEVSRVKPQFCLVNVTLQFEGSSSVFRAGQFEFIEQWLFNIIDSKLNLFKTLRF